MAKFVIAGKCNCPYFAKAELVGDQLARNLPNFHVHKISKNGNEWEQWLKEICKKNNWNHTKSPIIWRELIDRGGKGSLIGDANDFQEYVKVYYGINSKLTSFDLRKISSENEETLRIIEQEQHELKERIKPLFVTISHANSPVTYHIVSQILSGIIEGFDRDIKIKLFDKKNLKELDGVRMEIEDLASASLRNVEIETDSEKAFKNADLIILLDELENLNLEKDELPPRVLAKYYNPYVDLANLIDNHAKSDCKILISPLESHSHIYGLVSIFTKTLKRLSNENVLGNSLYDELIAKSVLSKRLKLSSFNIRDVVVIGQSIQESHYIDIAQGKVTGFDGAIWARPPTHWRNLVEMIADVDWMQKEFPLIVHLREKQIKETLRRDSVITFSQSIIKILQLWLNVHNDDDMLHSGVVYAKGFNSIKQDICLSLPIVFHSGKYHLNTHFKHNSEVLKIVHDIAEETALNLSEKFQDDVFNLLDTRTPEPTPLPTKIEEEVKQQNENNIEETKSATDEMHENEVPRERMVEFNEQPIEYEDQRDDLPDETDDALA